MQNHMPYYAYYPDNNIEISPAEGFLLKDKEQEAIRNCSKGIEYTDQFTRDFS